jgi:hypothetical protein
MSSRRALTIAMAFVIAGVTLAAQNLNMDALLRRSDVGGFVPVACRIRLSMQQEGVAGAGDGRAPAVSEVELWRSGANRTLVRFLDPKERGKYLLRLGADLWFIAPGAKNPVKLSPTHRVYGAATIDVLLGMHLADNYRIAGTSSGSTPAGAVVVFDLQAKTEQQQFASVRYTVQAATERPVSALYRLRSGRDATLIEFFEWAGGARGPSHAKRILVRDLLRKGAATRIETVEFEERAVPEGLFDLKDPTARKALERIAQSHSLLKQNH